MSSTKDPRFKNELPDAHSLPEYLKSYAQQVQDAIAKVSGTKLQEAFTLIEGVIAKNKRVLVGGNGGSSAIADHLCCDWMKGTHLTGKPTLKVQSLTSSVALLTAITNDFSQEEGFSKQIEFLGEPGDVVVLISSSGNSPNILKAAEQAKAKGLSIIGLCGFTGGKLKDLANVALYVPCNNYGIVEDCHQMIMHVLAQYLAKQRDPKA